MFFMALDKVMSLSVIAKAYDVLIDLMHACERTITLLTWG